MTDLSTRIIEEDQNTHTYCTRLNLCQAPPKNLFSDQGWVLEICEVKKEKENVNEHLQNAFPHWMCNHSLSTKIPGFQGQWTKATSPFTCRKRDPYTMPPLTWGAWLSLTKLFKRDCFSLAQKRKTDFLSKVITERASVFFMWHGSSELQIFSPDLPSTTSSWKGRTQESNRWKETGKGENKIWNHKD